MRRNHCKGYAYLTLLAGAIAISSCAYFSGNDYSGLVKKELAKGTRSDSLFLGLYLGMSSKGFYSHCWDLNKKGILTNGSENTTALFKMDTGLHYPADMNFYPDFDADKIFRMRVSFNYQAWAPWNKAQWSDSLFTDVLKMYKRWYPGGNAFMTLTDKERGTIYVKVDGNRRITIGKFDDRVVKVDYTDLLIEQKQNK